MSVVLLVSQTQAEGWQYPMVKRIVRILQRKPADHHLRKALEIIVLKGGFWRPFLPVPFTKASPQGKRLMKAWAEVLLMYPKLSLAQDFHWKFWHPERDMQDAVFLEQLPGNAPVLASLARQNAGVCI